MSRLSVEKLDEKRLNLIDELLKGKGVREAASAAGVSQRTAELWMGMAPFRDEMTRRRRSSLDVYITRAVILAALAQSRLTEILTSEPPAGAAPADLIRFEGLRLQAAMAALNSADRLSQHPSVNPDAAGSYRPMFVLPGDAKIAVLVSTGKAEEKRVDEAPPDAEVVDAEEVPGEGPALPTETPSVE